MSFNECPLGNHKPKSKKSFDNSKIKFKFGPKIVVCFSKIIHLVRDPVLVKGNL